MWVPLVSNEKRVGAVTGTDKEGPVPQSEEIDNMYIHPKCLRLLTHRQLQGQARADDGALGASRHELWRRRPTGAVSGSAQLREDNRGERDKATMRWREPSRAVYSRGMNEQATARSDEPSQAPATMI